jgi:hypothetical protein
MLECKPMNTPMEAKLKLLVDTSSELIDATLYRHIIGSLIVGYKVFHIEIDFKEQKTPKMTIHIPLVKLITLQIIRKSQ